MAAESVSLGQSLSPHQTFTPLNKLQEISPYVSEIPAECNKESNRIYISELERHWQAGWRREQVPTETRPGFKLRQCQSVL